MRINKKTIQNEIDMWTKFYNNYENLSVNILADVLASYKPEDRKDLIEKVEEVLTSVIEPIDKNTMYESIKGDLESFDRLNEEAKIALRTLQWVKDIGENKKETK